MAKTDFHFRVRDGVRLEFSAIHHGYGGLVEWRPDRWGLGMDVDWASTGMGVRVFPLLFGFPAGMPRVPAAV